MSRDAFEEVLGAMARAGLARLADAVFEKDGKQIPYRTVSLTPAGRAADETTPIEFIMKDIGCAAGNAEAQEESRRSKTAPAREGDEGAEVNAPGSERIPVWKRRCAPGA